MRCEQITANKYSLRSYNEVEKKSNGATKLSDEKEANFCISLKTFSSFCFLTSVNESTRNIKNPVTDSIEWKNLTELNWILKILYFFLTSYNSAQWRNRHKPLIFFLLYSLFPPFDIVLTKSLSIHLTLNDSTVHSPKSFEKSRRWRLTQNLCCFHSAEFPSSHRLSTPTNQSEFLHIYLLYKSINYKFCEKCNFIFPLRGKRKERISRKRCFDEMIFQHRKKLIVWNCKKSWLRDFFLMKAGIHKLCLSNAVFF